MWAVEERASGSFVGRVGLHFPDGWPDREVAWALARPYWAEGSRWKPHAPHWRTHLGLFNGNGRSV
jgi:hypothetical protein